MDNAVVYFRADGNSQIGLGHIYRTLALVDMLKDDFDCYFLTCCPLEALKQKISASAKLIELPVIEDKEEEAAYIVEHYLSGEDIVVLDGYQFTTAYQETIRQGGTRVVCIDDLHDIHFVADAVINHNSAICPSDYSKEAHTKLYIGFDYVLLRPAFLKEIKLLPKASNQQEVFVCMGGADPQGLYKKAVEAIVQAGSVEKVHLLLGNSIVQDAAFSEWLAALPIPVQCYSNIDEHQIIAIVKQCSLAICPSSTICLEMMCLKINIVTGWFVDNQRIFSNFLHEQGLAFSLGNLKESSVAMFQEAIIKGSKQNHIEQQLLYFKKDSTEPIKAIFEELLEAKK